MLVQKVRKIENTRASLLCINILTLVEVLLSQFEWKSRDSPTETRLTDRYRSTDSLSFMTPANFPCAMTVRRMANDVTYIYNVHGVASPFTCTIYDCIVLLSVLFTRLFVVYKYMCMFVVVYRSHSARVQKSSYENYAPGYVPSVNSFRRQRGVKAQQQAPPTRQIFVEKEVIS